MSTSHGEALTIRRSIRATPEKIFDAWTKPDHLRKWWGPQGVRCSEAEIDLRVGGRYRIANELPDGSTIWIEGEFEQIERPHRLVYTWTSRSNQPQPERVSVRFEAHGDATAVTITHERIATPETRDDHESGWKGCLEGLSEYLAL